MQGCKHKHEAQKLSTRIQIVQTSHLQQNCSVEKLTLEVCNCINWRKYHQCSNCESYCSRIFTILVHRAMAKILRLLVQSTSVDLVCWHYFMQAGYLPVDQSTSIKLHSFVCLVIMAINFLIIVSKLVVFFYCLLS